MPANCLFSSAYFSVAAGMKQLVLLIHVQPTKEFYTHHSLNATFIVLKSFRKSRLTLKFSIIFETEMAQVLDLT